MRRRTIALIVAAAALTAIPATAAVVDPDIRVVIRTYDAASPDRNLSPALAVAGAILEQAGIGITWMSCNAVLVTHRSPCLTPLTENELSIRFVRLPPHQAEQHLVALGDSLVDTRLRAGSLATIYVDRVWTLAARCHVDVDILLGRALAHEVGHLLLGTPAHASSGLMRAEWSQETLRREARDDWMFTARDARSMRDAVRLRMARQMASARIGQ